MSFHGDPRPAGGPSMTHTNPPLTFTKVLVVAGKTRIADAVVQCMEGNPATTGIPYKPKYVIEAGQSVPLTYTTDSDGRLDIPSTYNDNNPKNPISALSVSVPGYKTVVQGLKYGLNVFSLVPGSGLYVPPTSTPPPPTTTMDNTNAAIAQWNKYVTTHPVVGRTDLMTIDTPLSIGQFDPATSETPSSSTLMSKVQDNYIAVILFIIVIIAIYLIAKKHV